jgi:Tol biopolymer transport system component
MKPSGTLRSASRSVTIAGAVAALLIVCLASSASAAAVTRRASLSSGGKQGNGNSAVVEISGDGRSVVFESGASNLVKGDTNGVSDIFVRNIATGKISRVSVGGTNRQANGPSHSARGISYNGRYVVFESFATNLVKGDTNGTWDVFVRDRKAHKTTRMSVSSTGKQGNGTSADPVVSASGRYVAYESSASDLVSNDANGAVTDVFVRDRKAHRTRLVSVSTKGAHGNGSSSDPVISATGRYIAFEAVASNLVPRDTNAATDILLRDMTARRTTRMSVTSKGGQGIAGSYSASITPDGRYVAFESFSNLAGKDGNHVADVFLRDRVAGKTYRISVSSTGRAGNGYSSDPAISANGRYVAFESAATNFVAHDTNAHVDVFIRDRATGKTRCASLTRKGHVGNAAASDPSFSDDGKVVVFEAEASNLVAGDTNGHTDAFFRKPLW